MKTVSKRAQAQLGSIKSTREIGFDTQSGRQYGLYSDEFLAKLRGIQGSRVYREMTDNDPVVGGVMSALQQMIAGAKWEIVGGSQEGREFLRSVSDSMDHTWRDAVANATTFLPYGYAILEVVYRKRDDGRYGVRKMGYRPQWTIDDFLPDKEKNEYRAVRQITDDGTVDIDLSRCVHITTLGSGHSPSGRSVLRNVYSSYYYATQLQTIEAIGLERDLSGMPIARVPSNYLSEDATDDEKLFVSNLNKMIANVKKNSQASMIIPSDTWEDDDGKASAVYQVSLELLGGPSRAQSIEAGGVIVRHRQDMARALLADFIMLGTNDRGSFALSKSKTDLFLKASEGHNKTVVDAMNSQFVPMLWNVNGLPLDTMPKFVAGEVAPVDLDELGKFVRDLSLAGASLFPDEKVENQLRNVADLPLLSPDTAVDGLYDDDGPNTGRGSSSSDGDTRGEDRKVTPGRTEDTGSSD